MECRGMIWRPAASERTAFILYTARLWLGCRSRSARAESLSSVSFCVGSCAPESDLSFFQSSCTWFTDPLATSTSSTFCSMVADTVSEPLLNQFLSWHHDSSTSTGNAKSVISASQISTSHFELRSSTTTSQTYDRNDAMVVITKTPNSLTCFGSSTTHMHTPLMHSKLKAAEPTIVDAPSSPGTESSELTVSMIESRISGALLPRARSVRLATVSFQTVTVIVTVSPVASSRRTTSLAEVIFSIADMKMSEIMAMPKNTYISAPPYNTPRRAGDQMFSAGTRIHESHSVVLSG
eukprot:gene10280-biopygen10285